MEEKNFVETFNPLNEYLSAQSVNRLVALAKERGEVPSQILFVSKNFISPRIMVLVAIFGGIVGIDRFVLKDTGVGILKLLTSGVCCILWLVDIFSIKKKTVEYNEKILQDVLIMIK